VKGLPKNIAERMQMQFLLLQEEDLIHLSEGLIPAIFMIDHDVKISRQILKELHDNYMECNMDDLYEKYKNILGESITTNRETFDKKHKAVRDILESEVETLKMCKQFENINNH